MKVAVSPNAGLLVTASAPANVHRDLILRLAAQHGLPAVYPYRYFVAAGGLASYGPDTIDQYRRAAGYVDRALSPATLRKPDVILANPRGFRPPLPAGNYGKDSLTNWNRCSRT